MTGPLSALVSDSSFRDALHRGDTVVGTFITVGRTEVVEICGAVGLDFVILDTEHTPVGWESLSAMCGSALLSGAFPILRVSSTRRELASRALDAGARGVMFPQVNSAEEALIATRSCRYPPDGSRGVAATRLAGFGVSSGLQEHIAMANRSVACIIQVESRSAIDQIEEIVVVPGIDCLFVGLSDLSVDLGHPGEFDHPEVDGALERVLQAAQPHGIAVGIPVADLSLVAAARRRGISLFATTDRAVVASGMRTFLTHCRGSAARPIG